MIKTKIISIYLIFTLSAYIIFAESGNRTIKNDAFTFGEKLEYKVGMISGPLKGLGGSGGISISNTKKQFTNSAKEKRDCYDILFWVNSEGLVDMLYSVNDKYKTLVDVAGIFPYEFHQRIREGSYKKDFKATFDQLNNTAIVGNNKYKVEDNVQDVLSALYYFRTFDLSKKKNGDVIELSNFYKDSVYKLPVKIVKREIIKVPAGKFKTILVQPLVAEGGLFKFNNTISIWITDDDKKIPVKVATSIVIGDVGAELKKYSGIKGKITAKID
ncbi:MAG: DUF3108 domain-containing protein [Bacteroidetes bacterium]|nr:DUF3108 domain-containing protein [Bacteroidota bacterium]